MSQKGEILNKVENPENKRIVLSEIAESILAKRYYHDEEDWHDLCKRVASIIAKDDENLAEQFFDIIYSKDFLPNSPTLANAGKEGELQQLSACFILPVEDDLEQIMKTVGDTAKVHKTGGGTGFDFSSVRPKGAPVSSNKGVASGALSWMRIINATTEEVKQGGMRRGANMGALRVDHPEIVDFILSKKNDRAMTNFNISVSCSDVFMNAVDQGHDYELVNPYDGSTELMNAREIFDMICQNAWESGEPGMIFIDSVNSTNPVPHLGAIKSSNPCGEFYFIPFGVCNLGSINLVNMLELNDNHEYEINFDRLKEVTEIAVTFLDKVIDVNYFPLPEITEMAMNTRPIGLGVMGFADMLIYLKTAYDSEKGREIAEDIMRLIDEVGWHRSNELGLELGTFPEFKPEYLEGQETPRNCQITTIAPTGTLATIADVSFGIEPSFSFVYKRKILDTEFIEIHPFLEKLAKEEGFYSDELMEKIASTPSLEMRELDEIPDHIKEYFITAFDISPENHILMQAAFQKYVDNAVSKTINLPYDATPEQIGELYMMGWKHGCKGLTIYRDGSRDDQVIVAAKEETVTYSHQEGISVTTAAAFPQIDIMGNPEVMIEAMSGMSREDKYELLQRLNLFGLDYATSIDLDPKETYNGKRVKYITGCGEMYCQGFQNIADDGEAVPWEMFVTPVGGGCKAHTEAVAITLSLALQGRANIKNLVYHWNKIRCDACKDRDTDGKSCPSILANHVKGMIKDTISEDIESTKKKTLKSKKVAKPVVEESTTKSQNLCPECGDRIRQSDGCRHCVGCGWTRCD